MPYAVDYVSFGDGEIASIAEHLTWSDSPLKAPEAWPQSLCTVADLMFNSKFPMFLAWGPGLGFLYNDAYARILGDKHPQAFARPFQEVWSEIWPDIEPIVDRAMAGESSYFENLPLTIHRKGYDEQVWFTFSYSPVRDEAGAVAGLYCACTETTQQVLAEQRHVDEIKRFRELFQQAPGIISVLSGPEHTIELANTAYYNFVGHRELLGKPVRDALPELAGQGLFELLDRVYTNGEPYVGRAVPIQLYRNGTDRLEDLYVDFVYQPIRTPAGQVTGIFVEGSDVTEAVLAGQALKESEQQLRQLADTIPHLAWMANPCGSMIWYNRRFYEYTGLTFEELKGWGWQQIHDPTLLPAVKKEFSEAIAEGKPFETTVPLRSVNGEFRTFYVKAAPLRDSSGSIVRWFGTHTDIHEIEKTRKELQASNRRKDEFLAMLAHELRNPLAPISTAAELLRLSDLDPERIRNTSEVISRQLAHMTELVDDLLDVSRVTRGLVNLQEEEIAMNEVLNDAVEQVGYLASTKNQDVLVDSLDEPVFVKGDRTRLIQIFSNILNNATRYTQDHGRIHVRAQASGQEVEVRIRDNGVGIEPDLLPHIFDLFTQAQRSPDRSQGGLGLGLALVRSLVELHGGRVSAYSEGSQKGSEFCVALPRLGSVHEPAAQSENAATTRSGPRDVSIMIVDDNVDAAQTLAMLLESHGYTTFPEYSAMDAIKCLDKYKPQVAILDIGLPQMDGYELARHLRSMREGKEITFIALTGYGQSNDREQSRAAGFRYHLTKPANVQELLGLLAEIHQ